MSDHELSFVSANFVARELGYDGIDDWMRYDIATNAAFRPLHAFPERLDCVLGAAAAQGFTAVDLWVAHLSWRWATRDHVLAARRILDRHGLRVVSLAGNFGATPSELADACRLAVALDVDLLGGMGRVVHEHRDGAEDVLRDHGVRFAYENHPERTPDEVLELLGDASDVLGTAIDTGWWATQGYDPVDAIGDLQGRTFHVHLKDVPHVGLPHLTCEHGQGVVDVPGCVEALVETGYTGAISVEHEPYDEDPAEACGRMRARLEPLLAGATGAGRT